MVALEQPDPAYAVLDTFLFGRVTLQSFLGSLYGVLLGDVPTHLWFLYMMVGLYLLTPLLRAFIRGAKRSDFHWFFLVVGVFVFCLPLFLNLRGSQTVTLYANKLYLNFATTYPPLAYVGYFVAGYYLKTYPLGRLAEGLIYVLGIAGAFFTVGGSSFLNAGNGPGQFNGLMMSYLTPNVCAMSVAMFVLFRYVLGISEERARRQRVGRLADYTFGVYLVHIVFLTCLRYFGLSHPPITPLLGVPLLTLSIAVPSFAVSWLLHKIPVVGRYII